MKRKSVNSEQSDSIDSVVNALDDCHCRAILNELSEPMTAGELIERCEISQSSVYRKLCLLTRASLVAEQYTINSEGSRITLYERNVEAVTIRIEGGDDFDISVKRPTNDADQRLATMWSKMRGES
jgi:DNA-binding transcriptional ArsR family regulator